MKMKDNIKYGILTIILTALAIFAVWLIITLSPNAIVACVIFTILIMTPITIVFFKNL